MKLDSYWLDTAPAFSEGAEGPVDGRANVVVIGGGFTGLSAALELATRGVSVTVLEAGRIASEASGRNGGQCNTGVAQDFASLAARVGLEQARGFYRAYESAVASVESIVTRHQIDCDLVRTGKLKLAAFPVKLRAIRFPGGASRPGMDLSRMQILQQTEYFAGRGHA